MVIKRDVSTQIRVNLNGVTYLGADMPYWMRITGVTGMHAAYLLGYLASYGCLRMRCLMAEVFFKNIEMGTPMSIELGSSEQIKGVGFYPMAGAMVRREVEL